MRRLLILCSLALIVFSIDYESQLDEDSNERNVLGSIEKKTGKLSDRLKILLAKMNGTMGDLEDGRSPNPFGILSALPGILSVGLRVQPSSEESPMSDMVNMGLSDIGERRSLFHKNEMLEGPHICVREINKEILYERQRRSPQPKCTLFKQAKICVQNIYLEPFKEATETQKIQECCDGYTTNDIAGEGCNLGEKHHVSKSTLNITSEQKNRTIIAYDGNQIVLDGPMRNSYEWSDGEVLKQGNNSYLVTDKYNRITGVHSNLVNCVPVVETAKVPGETFIHVLQTPIKPAKESVLSALKEDGQFKTFISILSNATRVLLASPSKETTIFAFTDERFEQYPEELKEQIREQTGCSKGIDENHILEGTWCDMSNSEMLLAIKNKGYSFETTKNETKINGVKILDYETLALNGRLVVVDGLLNRNELITWQENLRAVNVPMSESLSNFSLPSDELVTVFVPPAIDASVEGYQFTEELSKNHIIVGKILNADKLPKTVETLAGTKMFTSRKVDSSTFFARKPATVRIGCSRILVDKSVNSCNSVIHFINKPLPLNRHSITSLLESKENLQKFKQLWGAANKSNATLSGPLTLFVPVDDAFSVNGFRRMAADTQGVVNFVERHSSDELICEDDLSNTEEIRVRFIPTRAEMSLTTKTLDGEIFIEGAKIMDTFVVSDGVIHVIDAIIPRKETPHIRQSADKHKLPFDNPFSTLLGLFGGLPRAA